MRSLPNELVAEVFCYVGVGALIKCSQANVCWNALSKIRYVWEFKKVRWREDIKDAHLIGICHVHTLNFFNTRVRDASVLCHIHTLNLNSTKVVDVGVLGGMGGAHGDSPGHVHNLQLGLCKYVNDFSALGDVHTLYLGDTIVWDVSVLGHVHTLNLGWTRVEDVSALVHLHTLYLCEFYVKDVSALGYVNTLKYVIYK